MTRKLQEAARLCEIRRLKNQLLALLKPGECLYFETKPVRGELKNMAK
jgi:hypothetical protein